MVVWMCCVGVCVLGETKMGVIGALLCPPGRLLQVSLCATEGQAEDVGEANWADVAAHRFLLRYVS